MVTGVETASLVLAALPMLVLLLDKYKSGLRRMKPSIRRRTHIKTLTSKLVIHHVLLTENMRLVLLRADCECESSDPRTLFEQLSSNELKNKLEEILGKQAYIAYIEGVSSAEGAVRRLIAELTSLLSTPSVCNP